MFVITIILSALIFSFGLLKTVLPKQIFIRSFELYWHFPQDFFGGFLSKFRKRKIISASLQLICGLTMNNNAMAETWVLGVQIENAPHCARTVFKNNWRLKQSFWRQEQRCNIGPAWEGFAKIEKIYFSKRSFWGD